MITAIELENFKAFGKRTRIELAPITLIVGENSAGKSSILQSLSLLKQTRESREHGALLLPRADSGTVDLGSFQEVLFDHDQTRQLSIRLALDTELATEGGLEFGYFLFDDRKGFPKSLEYEAQFMWPKDATEVQLGQLVLGLGDARSNFATFKPVKVKKSEMREYGGPFFYFPRGRRSSFESEVRVAECDWITDAAQHWEPAFQGLSTQLSAIQKALVKMQKEVQAGRVQVEGSPEEAKRQAESLARSTFEAIQFYETLPSASAFTKRLRDAQIGRRVALDGFLPAGPIGRQFNLPEEIATQRFSRGGRLPALGHDASMVAAYCGRLAEVALESLFPMGPFRRPPERWYIYTGTKPQDVGYKGELLPDLLFRSPELVKDANKWLSRLDVGYELDPRQVGRESSDLFEVRLRDKRRQATVDVALSDVGFGISQLLPFLVQCLATERQIISIEQPEVHIHPRLQADLGDLIAEATKKPRWHRFIIETHSEHLVLRLQKLIREHVISSDDVSVIFISRSANGAHAERLRLDDKGEFIDDWPGGFFPERLRELI